MGRRGFTLIELMVVLAIIATLLTIAAPRYFAHLERARESALKETLFVVRDAIDKFHGDTGRFPETLDELVTKRYLRKRPTDPLTDSGDSWTVLSPPGGGGGIYDLRSGAPGKAGDGTAYADW